MNSSLLHNIPIPEMLEIQQLFDTTNISDIKLETRNQLERPSVKKTIKPGMHIAITVGSRGIANLAEIIIEVVACVKKHGAFPFIIPAMGSHGGATAAGQEKVITEYGITEKIIDAPVRSTMDVRKIAELSDGTPIVIDAFAAGADGIIVINRIKPHTAFRGTYESGVMKMMAIGLGKQKGAEICHREGILHIAKNVEKYAFGVLQSAPILFGIGIVENAFDQTYSIAAMAKSEIPEIEPKLLEAAKSKMAKICFDQVDVLVVDQIGKNISGEGMDPNITGRWIVPTIKGGINAARLAVLDLTDETLGNAVGLGMADVCSKQAMEKMSRENTYPNSLTSTVTCLCSIPMYFDSHRETIQAAIKMTPGKNPDDITMIRIRDTLSLSSILISKNLLPDASRKDNIRIKGKAAPMQFNSEGNLF